MAQCSERWILLVEDPHPAPPSPTALQGQWSLLLSGPFSSSSFFFFITIIIISIIILACTVLNLKILSWSHTKTQSLPSCCQQTLHSALLHTVGARCASARVTDRGKWIRKPAERFREAGEILRGCDPVIWISWV